VSYNSEESLKCPFCPLVKKSEWYLTACDGIVVCRDLNDRLYKYRILVVGSGNAWHRPITEYSEEEIKRFLILGRKVAQCHVVEGLANRITDEDLSHFTYPTHWHLQICME